MKTRTVDDPDVRRCRIEKKDILKYGYTAHCPGCTRMARGLPAQSHSEICRNRITEQLQKDNDVRLDRQKRRMDADADERAKGSNKGTAEENEAKVNFEQAEQATENEQMRGEPGSSSSGLKRSGGNASEGDEAESKIQKIISAGMKRDSEGVVEGEEVARKIQKKVH